MSRKRTSPIWTTSKKEFAALVKKSKSIADILRHFGFAVTGRGHRMVKDRCEQDSIDTSHIPTGLGNNRGRKFNRTQIPLATVMIKDSTYNGGHLKRRLIDSGMLKNKCSICLQQPNWKGKPLVMRLDHINGDRHDHRIENLRLVCPNCDSQLPTFSRGKKANMLV